MNDNEVIETLKHEAKFCEAQAKRAADLRLVICSFLAGLAVVLVLCATGLWDRHMELATATACGAK